MFTVLHLSAETVILDGELIINEPEWDNDLLDESSETYQEKTRMICDQVRIIGISVVKAANAKH